MKPQKVKIKFSREASGYEIIIGYELLHKAGKWARKCIGDEAAKVHIISNPAVYKLYGKQTAEGLGAAGFAVSFFLMGDGERHKNIRSTESALKSLAESQLSRTDAVVALGGGVVGDLSGFASAIYLRGLPFLQIPTTLLSMIDSSVGGKTGVNSAFGKNLIGSFHQPSGVLIDPGVLQTLPVRELTAGLCEMVKHGAIGGKALMKQTEKMLSEFPVKTFSENHSNSNFRSEISNLVAANVVFKASIVAGDERESANRIDAKSRKILNFGHTLAHALEKVTDYKYLKHGEAVGYGILFAAELSKSLALCDEKDVKLLNDVVQCVGSLPSLANIDNEEVLEAFRFDKKHLAGSLQMVLLKGIGKPVIVSEKDIPRTAVKKVLKELLNRWS